MRVRVDELDEREYGIVEIERGEHAETKVTVWIADDGAPVVQIDTPLETGTHDFARVYVNDALVSGKEAAASQS